MLLGAGLALGATWLSSALAPQGQVYRSQNVSESAVGELRAGAVLYGLNLVQGAGGGLEGLAPTSPVTVQRLEGGWALVDYPEGPAGVTWVNTRAMISYRTRR
jgi:hypothetical protein